MLRMAVNKLGDPSNIVAARATRLLQQQLLQQHHSAMKGVVVNEVEIFLFRPNLSPRAVYTYTITITITITITLTISIAITFTFTITFTFGCTNIS